MHAIFGMTLFICIKWLVNHCAYWNKKYFFLYYLNKRWTMTKTKYEDIVRCLHGDTRNIVDLRRHRQRELRVSSSESPPLSCDPQNPTNNMKTLQTTLDGWGFHISSSSIAIPFSMSFHCDSLVFPLHLACHWARRCNGLSHRLEIKNVPQLSQSIATIPTVLQRSYYFDYTSFSFYYFEYISLLFLLLSLFLLLWWLFLCTNLQRTLRI